jgi:5-methyltetrahydrofolate--homocysteine methyltransferase
MVSMEQITKEIKSEYPEVLVVIGVAPITAGFAERIGADIYFPDPQGALDLLNSSHV